jgi:membrane protein YdbS with pleckstrin-like domain
LELLAQLIEKCVKLVDQSKALVVAVTLLLAAAVGLLTELLKFDPGKWSWPELSFALLAILLVAAIVVRSRSAHTSRLIDPDAL